MAQATMLLPGSSQPPAHSISKSSSSRSHGARSAAELIESINKLRILQENHEQVGLLHPGDPSADDMVLLQQYRQVCRASPPIGTSILTENDRKSKLLSNSKP